MLIYYFIFVAIECSSRPITPPNQHISFRDYFIFFIIIALFNIIIYIYSNLERIRIVAERQLIVVEKKIQ